MCHYLQFKHSIYKYCSKRYSLNFWTSREDPLISATDIIILYISIRFLPSKKTLTWSVSSDWDRWWFLHIAHLLFLISRISLSRFVWTELFVNVVQKSTKERSLRCTDRQTRFITNTKHTKTSIPNNFSGNVRTRQKANVKALPRLRSQGTDRLKSFQAKRLMTRLVNPCSQYPFEIVFSFSS